MTSADPSEASPRLPADRAWNVAVVGSGGREHALACGIARSPRLGNLYALPGNPGIRRVATCHPVRADDVPGVVEFCRQHDVHFVIIGPEDPLAAGLADALAGAGIAAFGPSKAAARLEADKAYAKALMRQAGVPTAEGRAFTDAEAAEVYVRRRGVPVVVKAAGLAKGKGVTLCFREEDAVDAIRKSLRTRVFGDAGATVVVEEYLEGVECSVLALVDRRDVFTLPLCRDHKPVGEGNTGPMTGGMGAFSPADTLDADALAAVERDVIVPVIDALAREGVEYRGCLYAGLMVTSAGPRVLEFNVRLGDPETQPLLMRWQGDVLEALAAVATGRLGEVADAGGIDFDPRPAVGVVLAAGGYPGDVRTGDVISGLDDLRSDPDVAVFHGATSLYGADVVTAGGRVLTVTALGDDLEAARDKAYAAARRIRFDGMHYRRDIGAGPAR